MSEINIGNDQAVGMDGAGFVCVQVPNTTMTRAEALRHAAWLVAVAEREDGEFDRVLKAVRSS